MRIIAVIWQNKRAQMNLIVNSRIYAFLHLIASQPPTFLPSRCHFLITDIQFFESHAIQMSALQFSLPDCEMNQAGKELNPRSSICMCEVGQSVRETARSCHLLRSQWKTSRERAACRVIPHSSPTAQAQGMNDLCGRKQSYRGYVKTIQTILMKILQGNNLSKFFRILVGKWNLNITQIQSLI